MDISNVLLVVVGTILLIVIILLVASGGMMGGMAMMVGMAANPVGAILILVLFALMGLIGYLVFF